MKYKIVEGQENDVKIEKITKQKKTSKPKKVTKKATRILEEDDIIEDLPEYIWQYEDVTFQNYDIEASNVVEEVYQQWLKNPGDFDVRSVKSGGFHYMVIWEKKKKIKKIFFVDRLILEK